MFLITRPKTSFILAGPREQWSASACSRTNGPTNGQTGSHTYNHTDSGMIKGSKKKSQPKGKKARGEEKEFFYTRTEESKRWFTFMGCPKAVPPKFFLFLVMEWSEIKWTYKGWVEPQGESPRWPPRDRKNEDSAGEEREKLKILYKF